VPPKTKRKSENVKKKENSVRRKTQKKKKWKKTKPKTIFHSTVIVRKGYDFFL
jgi:hypothetical protein